MMSYKSKLICFWVKKSYFYSKRSFFKFSISVLFCSRTTFKLSDLVLSASFSYFKIIFFCVNSLFCLSRMSLNCLVVWIYSINYFKLFTDYLPSWINYPTFSLWSWVFFFWGDWTKWFLLFFGSTGDPSLDYSLIAFALFNDVIVTSPVSLCSFGELNRPAYKFFSCCDLSLLLLDGSLLGFLWNCFEIIPE